MIKGGKGRSVFNLGGSNNYIRSEGQDTINGVQGAIDTVSLIGGGPQRRFIPMPPSSIFQRIIPSASPITARFSVGQPLESW
ncbi:hypothetical protein DOFOFD_11975 [Acetobacteraceae bacterium EV16P]|uniref:Uncharacterized protein n=1 Tax=Sorlinia euscelidii TaxID=3081148 RepID=A0ABU7U7V4_9PROT